MVIQVEDLLMSDVASSEIITKRSPSYPFEYVNPLELEEASAVDVADKVEVTGKDVTKDVPAVDSEKDIGLVVKVFVPTVVERVV